MSAVGGVYGCQEKGVGGKRKGTVACVVAEGNRCQGLLAVWWYVDR